MDIQVSRRNLIRSTGIAGAVAATLPIGSALAADCDITPSQTSGPFYPVQDQLDKDADLTVVSGNRNHATGEKIVINGTVRETACGSPIANALVEIWQACATGKYNHPDDPNTAELDPNFQYWGRTRTNAQGQYSFTTIKPGAYPATETWMRPPHIHFRVVAPGRPTLVTQMYFAGDLLNDIDEILLAIPAAKRPLVIASFTEQGGALHGTFDISLSRRLGVREGTPDID